MSSSKEKPQWYLEGRVEVEALFRRLEPGESQTFFSPSGRYGLEVSYFKTGKHTWSYSQGRVFEVDGDRTITVIRRNFSHFPFSWCEDHFSGGSYLIAGEDYQCQTVVELKTGRRIDHVDPDAEDGVAFCWAAHYPSQDGQLLFVDGCHWACPYDLILFDFKDPMNLPYPELKRWPVWEVHGFQEDGSFVFDYIALGRKSDLTLLVDLPDEVADELDESEEVDVIVQVTWRPDFSETQKSIGVDE